MLYVIKMNSIIERAKSNLGKIESMEEKRRLKMSVVAALCLADGIILAADSRLTICMKQADGSIIKKYNDNAIKVYRMKNKDIGILWCGDYKVGNLSIPQFMEFFGDKVCREDSIETVANKLNRYCKGNYREEILWLIAGYSDGEQYLYEVADDIVKRKNLMPNGYPGIGLTWEGEINISHKIINDDIPLKVNGKYLRGSDMPKMSLEDGIAFAKELLLETCNEHDGCGGSIDVLVIRSDGIEWMEQKEAKEIPEI